MTRSTKYFFHKLLVAVLGASYVCHIMHASEIIRNEVEDRHITLPCQYSLRNLSFNHLAF